MGSRKFFLGALVGALVLAMTPGAAGAREDGPKHQPNDYTIVFDDDFEALPGATAYQGELAGAAYKIEVPDNWNGVLVMWAHGYRGAAATGDTELTTDDHPLRPFLIANGYAWAASSYAKNDYNVGQGVLDTHKLVSYFNSKVGKADQVYITGASMGGHITAVSVEQFPNTYDGAMPVCGVVGDSALFDFFGDFSMSAQYLGGSSQSGFPVADPVTYFVSDIPTMKANLEDGPGAWPFALNPDGEKLKAITELRSGGERPNFDSAWLFWNADLFAGDFLFSLAADTATVPVNGQGVGNADTVYQFDTDSVLTEAEQTFNDGVFRQAKDPQALHPAGLAGVPRVSGDIGVPVLTLHNLGDLFVPFHMETEYGARVAAQGNSDLLVQRAIRGVNHCDFTPEELGTGFVDLVTWVSTGVKPGGDDVLNPTAVAAPDFGCAYSTPGHYLEGVLGLMAGCP